MEETEFEIVDPTGRQVINDVAKTSLPNSLDGKTIAFIWDYLFKGPEMFQIFRDHLKDKYRDLQFVDYEVFGNIHGSDPEEKENIEQLASRLATHEVDVAVVAVGA